MNSYLIQFITISALDGETENLVEEALFKASHSCTTLVIAHRLKSIQHADKIYVLQVSYIQINMPYLTTFNLKDGSVIEEGNHVELMSLNGMYFSMVQQQSFSIAPI